MAALCLRSGLPRLPVDRDAGRRRLRLVEEHGLTHANGDHFRQMVLSRGNTEDLAKMHTAWRGRDRSIDAMKNDRGLAPRNP